MRDLAIWDELTIAAAEFGDTASLPLTLYPSPAYSPLECLPEMPTASNFFKAPWTC